MKIRHMNIIFCSSCGPKIANKWHNMDINTLLFCNTCMFKCSKHAHFSICYGDKQRTCGFRWNWKFGRAYENLYRCLSLYPSAPCTTNSSIQILSRRICLLKLSTQNFLVDFSVYLAPSSGLDSGNADKNPL